MAACTWRCDLVLNIFEVNLPRCAPRLDVNHNRDRWAKNDTKVFWLETGRVALIQIEIGRFAPKYQEPNFGPTEVVITNREPKRDVSGQFYSKVLN
jgi:hypothetical protein